MRIKRNLNYNGSINCTSITISSELHIYGIRRISLDRTSTLTYLFEKGPIEVALPIKLFYVQQIYTFTFLRDI